MDSNLPSFLFYSPDYQLLICQRCQKAIGRTEAPKHLKNHPETIEIRSGTFDRVLQELQVRRLHEIHKDLVRDQPVDPFPFLSKDPGFQCIYEGCSRVFISRKGLANHQSANHLLKDHQNQEPYQLKCEVQSLSSHKYHFQVAIPAPSSSSTASSNNSTSPRLGSSQLAPDQSNELAILINQMIQDQETRVKESQKKQVFQYHLSRDEFTGFGLRSHYPEFLHGRDLAELKDLFQLNSSDQDLGPNPSEFLLISIIFQMMLGQSKVPLLSRNSRYRLNSFSQDRINLRPFHPVQQPTTIIKYARVIRAFLAFLLRTYRAQGPAIEDDSSQIDLIQPLSSSIQNLYTLTGQQRELLDDLVDQLAQVEYDADCKKNRLLDAFPGWQVDPEPSDDEDFDHLDEQSDDESDMDPGSDPDSDQEAPDQSSASSQHPEPSSSLTRGSLAHQRARTPRRPLARRLGPLASQPSQLGNTQQLALDAEGNIAQHFKDRAFPYQSIANVGYLIEKIIRSSLEKVLDESFTHEMHAFFACFCVDYSKYSIKRIDLISQSYSAFIYSCQLLMINFIWHDWTALLDSQASTSQIAHARPRYFHLIKDYMFQWFTNQSESAMGEILALRAYSMAIARSISITNIIVTRISDECYQIRGTRFTRQEFISLFQGLVIKGFEALDTLLIDPKILANLDIDLGQASELEDLSNLELHQNFRATNPILRVDQVVFRLRTLIRDPIYQRKWFEIRENQAVLRVARVQAYFRASHKFIRILLVLCHLASGAPARGTEITLIQHSNSMHHVRNLTLDPIYQIFRVQLRYSKTFNITGRERNAIRALPQPVSYLVLIYLVLIQPFLEWLYFNQYGHFSRGQELLFYSYILRKPLGSRTLGRALAYWSQTLIGKTLNIKNYRHLAQAFIRYGLNDEDILAIEAEELAAVDQSDELVAAEQMHHSKQTGLLIYARQASHLKSVRVDEQVRFMRFCQRYHDYFELTPNKFPFWDLYRARVGLEDPINLLNTSHQARPRALGEYSTDLFALRDLQQARDASQRSQDSSQQARDPNQLAAPRVLLSYLTYYLSLAHNNPLSQTAQNQIDPTDDEDQMNASHLANQLDIAYQARAPAPPIGPPDDWMSRSLSNPVLGIFREFIQDTNAEFRSPSQQGALFSLLNHETCLLMILPTAGGKTTLFFLSASLISSKTTLIVVPLVALKEEFRTKAQSLGLSCVFWEENHGRTPSNISLVLASVESIEQPSFLAWAEELSSHGSLDRIIFDEAHLIPTAYSYRLGMAKLARLRRIPVPFIFATATLSEDNERELAKMMRLPSSYLRIQAPINQPNIFYEVSMLPPKQSDHFDFLMQKVQEISDQMVRESRVLSNPRPSELGGSRPSELGGPRLDHSLQLPLKTIIYFQWIDDLVKFHEAFPDIAYYYSKLAEKDQQLTSFILNQKLVLAATNAISCGMNIPGVNLVIHYRRSWSFSDFIQESGRLCRNPKQIGYSLILTTAKDCKNMGDDEPSVRHMRDYLNQVTCRRQLIRLVFDRVVQDQCQPSDLACDLCYSRQKALFDARRDALKREQKGAFYQELLAKCCQVWEDFCLVCWFRLPLHSPSPIIGLDQELRAKIHHATSSCPNFRALVDSEQLTKVFGRTPKENTCCWKCLLPTIVCARLRGEYLTCSYPWLLRAFFHLVSTRLDSLNVSGGILRKPFKSIKLQEGIAPSEFLTRILGHAFDQFQTDHIQGDSFFLWFMKEVVGERIVNQQAGYI